MKRLAEKKWAAWIAALAWTLFALLASVAFRAVTAKAFSINDEITIKVLGNDVDQQGDTPSEWGTFYRGIELSETMEISYVTKSGDQGTATIQVVDEDNNIYTLTSDGKNGVKTEGKYGELTLSSPLYTEEADHVHDFTGGFIKEGESNPLGYTDKTHWAKCSCGFQIQVAHRPALDGSGKCADCGATLDDNYINQYSFSFDDAIEWTSEEESATIEITINNINLFAGVVLKLNLSCTGVLTMEGTDTFPYIVEVTGAGIKGEITPEPTIGDRNSITETIWEFHASEYLSSSGSSDMRTNIGSGSSITVALTPSGSDLSPYAGTYTDILTFSVTLEQENV